MFQRTTLVEKNTFLARFLRNLALLMHDLARFMQKIDIFQDFCKLLARNVLPERFLQEMCCLEISCKKCILPQLGYLMFNMVSGE